MSFTEIQPFAAKENDESTTYYFELENNKVYNYRITSDNYVTYAGKFTKKSAVNMEFTADTLETENKKLDRPHPFIKQRI